MDTLYIKSVGSLSYLGTSFDELNDRIKCTKIRTPEDINSTIQRAKSFNISNVLDKVEARRVDSFIAQMMYVVDEAIVSSKIDINEFRDNCSLFTSHLNLRSGLERNLTNFTKNNRIENTFLPYNLPHMAINFISSKYSINGYSSSTSGGGMNSGLSALKSAYISLNNKICDYSIVAAASGSLSDIETMSINKANSDCFLYEGATSLFLSQLNKGNNIAEIFFMQSGLSDCLEFEAELKKQSDDLGINKVFLHSAKKLNTGNESTDIIHISPRNFGLSLNGTGGLFEFLISIIYNYSNEKCLFASYCEYSNQYFFIAFK